MASNYLPEGSQDRKAVTIALTNLRLANFIIITIFYYYYVIVRLLVADLSNYLEVAGTPLERTAIACFRLLFANLCRNSLRRSNVFRRQGNELYCKEGKGKQSFQPQMHVIEGQRGGSKCGPLHKLEGCAAA